MERHGFRHVLFLSLGMFNLDERTGFNEKSLPPVAGTLFIASLATFYPFWVVCCLLRVKATSCSCLYLTLNNSTLVGLRAPSCHVQSQSLSSLTCKPFRLLFKLHF